jgi:GAF domain-containing protein
MSIHPPQDSELSSQLRRLVQVFEASARTILPTSSQDLLQSIVDAAARIFGAAAASIALVDETRQVLRFEVAHGAGQEDVVGQEISIDAGIAGYVAMTGNPIAVADVRKDPRFDQEFAKKTGYIPNSILAMPLVWNGRVIGVMEVLDKIDAPSFGMQDMELLGMFAHQAAIAIQQSQQYDKLGDAILMGIKELCERSPSLDLGEVLHSLSRKADEDQRARDLRTLAELLYAIHQFGDSERKLCLEVLSAFRDYIGSKQISF